MKGAAGRSWSAGQAGRLGEEAAARWLEVRGYRVVARHVRCRQGELDLVVRRGEVVAVVEVRARVAGPLGSGQEQALASVTAAKRRRLVRAARYLLALRPGLARYRLRFDVVAVTLDPRGRPARIVHLPGTFLADGSVV